MQEEVLDQVVSDLGPRPWAGFDQEQERAARRQATTGGVQPNGRPFAEDLVDGVLHDLWPMLAQRVDNYNAQWSKAWSKLEKELEAERACMKDYPHSLACQTIDYLCVTCCGVYE